MGFMDEVAANPPAIKWDNVGDVREITLTREPKKQQERDINGNLKTFPSGDPRYEWLFIGTDRSGEEHTIYAGWKMQEALHDAFEDAGIHDIVPGCKIKIKRTDDIPATQRGHSPTKTYQAKAEFVADTPEDEIGFD